MAVVKATLGALSQVAAAADPRDWPAAAPAFGLLLSLATDVRPKVRRRAQAGLAEALAALQGAPALPPASAAVLKGARLSGRVRAGAHRCVGKNFIAVSTAPLGSGSLRGFAGAAARLRGHRAAAGLRREACVRAPFGVEAVIQGSVLANCLAWMFAFMHTGNKHIHMSCSLLLPHIYRYTATWLWLLAYSPVPSHQRCGAVCKAMLPGPEAAARAAAAAPAKRRADAEAALARAVADALHLLGGLQQLLPLMAGAALRPPCCERCLPSSCCPSWPVRGCAPVLRAVSKELHLLGGLQQLPGRPAAAAPPHGQCPAAAPCCARCPTRCTCWAACSSSPLVTGR